eukprot:RCo029888
MGTRLCVCVGCEPFFLSSYFALVGGVVSERRPFSVWVAYRVTLHPRTFRSRQVCSCLVFFFEDRCFCEPLFLPFKGASEHGSRGLVWAGGQLEARWCFVSPPLFFCSALLFW